MKTARPLSIDFAWRACCLLIAGWLAATAGCQQAQSQQGPAPPPPAVTVARPVSAALTEYKDFTGVTEAVESVEIRARVQGFLQEIHFTEGAEVKAGDPLYTIDPRTYKAELDRATAELTRLRAQLSLAMNEERRSARLRETSAVTEEEYVQRVAARQQAEASVQEAQAAIDLAELNLSFTDVRAPIDGRVGRTLLTVGNLVGYNDPTLLTTIVRLDPIYVVFEGTERGFLNYERRIREEGLASAADRSIPIFIGLEGEQGYPHQGVIDFRENQVDPRTGTIRIRATMPNPDRIAVPGMFARVRLPIGRPTQQLLVPQTAVGADQRGDFVTVIGDDNVAKTRPVKTGRTIGDLIIVTEGLTTGDRVVINGTQKARPGATVAPELVELTPPPPDPFQPGNATAPAPAASPAEETPSTDAPAAPAVSPR